jgi:chromate transporter
MNQTLVSLAAIFSQLSLLAFGGGNTILPEMQRQVVDVHAWMTRADFSALFALAQAAPGPNMMIVTLIGWHVAGWPGVFVTSVAKFGPSSLVTVTAMHVWERFKDRPWRRHVQLGLVPITAGLVAASAALIAQASDTTWTLAAITLAVGALATRTNIHPLWLLAAGSLIGLTGFGQL